MKISGLADTQVLAARRIYGENIISSQNGVSGFAVFFSQFSNPLLYILIAVGAVSFFLGEHLQLVLIAGVVVLNVLMGFFQEYSAQKAVQALRKIIEPRALVIRNGKRQFVESRELVPGDAVILGDGDKIPADGRMLECFNLLVDESILTGESVGARKDCALRKNIFAGTTILSGRGIAEVEFIGNKTEIGKIGKSLSEIDNTKTPLQIELENFSYNLVYIILGVSALIFALTMSLRMGFAQSLQLAIVLAVAAIPEGLPTAITLILALGARRVLKKGGLIKRLLSVETLGVTSVICTDKTGTITEGKMKVVKADLSDIEQARLCMILNNDRRNSIELALWNYAANMSPLAPEEIFDAVPRINEIGFNSESKYMVTYNLIDNHDYLFAKGAPEAILPFCGIEPDKKNAIEKQIKDYASQGFIVLALAFKNDRDLGRLNNFTLAGIVAMEDPIRPDAKAAFSDAMKMGIEIKIVTGDRLETAVSVAKKLGLAAKPDDCVDFAELQTLSDDDLARKVKTAAIFARVTPLQKLRIINAIQKNGNIAAMTGDGVNDAPALKRADIGVVMLSGSEVAKEAGDLILLDNGIKTIVAACEEGRTILQNIKKVVGYTLSNSFAEIVLILCAIAMRLPLSLTIMQILWLHFLCDGPIDLLLGFEPMESSVKRVDPKKLAKEEILSSAMKIIIAGISLITGILAFMGYYFIYFRYGDLLWARTLAFCVLAVPDLIFVFSFKSLQNSILKTENFLHNFWLLAIAAVDLALILFAVYTATGNHILETHRIGYWEWLYIAAVTLIDVLFIEIIKYFANRPKSKVVI